jgi:RNA polymerase sigma-70 factor (ECF subfamily)
MSKTQRESLWVLRAQVGDREAMDLLLSSIQKPIYMYIRNIVQDAAVAEDTLQDVFLAIIRKLKTLRDPGLFRPWIYRIASRHAIKTLGKEKRWRSETSEQHLLDIQTLEHAPVEDGIDASEVAKSLGRLSPPVRAVMALHYLECLTIREVAVVLDLPFGTVKSRLAYGLQKLRKDWNCNQ